MITVLFSMTIKPEREDECVKTAKEQMSITRTKDEGCTAYTFFRRGDQPNEMMLFEQWRDADSLNAHIARLQRDFGPPDEDEPYPPTHHRRRLPKAFLALFEKTEAVRYEPLA